MTPGSRTYLEIGSHRDYSLRLLSGPSRPSGLFKSTTESVLVNINIQSWTGPRLLAWFKWLAMAPSFVNLLDLLWHGRYAYGHVHQCYSCLHDPNIIRSIWAAGRRKLDTAVATSWMQWRSGWLHWTSGPASHCVEMFDRHSLQATYTWTLAWGRHIWMVSLPRANTVFSATPPPPRGA